jgi:hypothetical protein
MTLWDHDLYALLERQNLANRRRVWRELVQTAQRHVWSYGDFLALLHVDFDEAMRDEPDQESDAVRASGNGRQESSTTTKTR